VKHLKKVSSEHRATPIIQADAKSDYIDSLYRSTVDFFYSKFTQTPTGSST